MKPVGSIVFGICGDRHGRRKALSAVVFVMALTTFAMGLLPTYERVGVLARLYSCSCGCSRRFLRAANGRLDRLHRRIAPAVWRGFFGTWQLVGVGSGFLFGSLTAALLNTGLSQADRLAWSWWLPFLFGIAVGV